MKPIASADVYDLPGTDYALVDLQHIKGAHNRWLVLPVRGIAWSLYEFKSTEPIASITGRRPTNTTEQIALEVARAVDAAREAWPDHPTLDLGDLT